MRWANCFTCGSLAFCAAIWPSSTSAMPPCAALLMKLRSERETALLAVMLLLGAPLFAIDDEEALLPAVPELIADVDPVAGVAVELPDGGVAVFDPVDCACAL